MKYLYYLLFSTLLLVSCSGSFQKIKGNGNLIQQNRTVTAFSELSAEGSIDILLEQGDSYKVTVEAEENLQEYIEVIASGNKLIVRNKGFVNLKPTKKMQVHVVTPSLQILKLSGATDVKGKYKFLNNGPLRVGVSGAANLNFIVDAPAVTLDISGSGDVQLEGDTRDFDLDISGAGDAKCFNLRAENTTVNMSGAGHAEVFASKNVDANLSGAASLKYKGHPASSQIKKTGAADIQSVE